MNRKYIGIVAAIILSIGIIGSIVTFPSAMKQAEGKKFEEVISPQGIDNIQINGKNTKITVQPTTNHDISVIYKTSTTEKDALHVETKSSTLFIQVEDDYSQWFNIGFFPFTESLQVFIPEEAYNELAITNDNGTIDVREMAVEDLKVVSNNGKIDVQDIAGSIVDIQTNNGMITIMHVTGEVISQAHNGTITLKTEHLDQHVDLATHNGKITIQTDKKPTNTTFDFKIGNGKIKVFGGSDWDTVIGNGEYIVKASAKNGMITVTQ